MTETQFDILGIGNAIVDILAKTDDAFLVNEAISKGTMTLIDAARAADLFSKMGSTTTMSGGSAANTVSGIAGLGGKAAYIGKVADDQMGQIFAHDLRALGVHYQTPAALMATGQGQPTATCLILITPDAQRSMNTHLGVSVELGSAEIDEKQVAAAKVTYLEGYLFDKPEVKAAFAMAANYAKAHGRKVALTLSDPFCVSRHRDDFQKLVTEKIDILFANEAEACGLFESNDLDTALAALENCCELAVVTCSEKGSIILNGGKRIQINAKPVAHVVDTTGAGDLYAAGFLYGYTQGLALAECGRIASICAAEIISHVGPRPQADLKKLI